MRVIRREQPIQFTQNGKPVENVPAISMARFVDEFPLNDKRFAGSFAAFKSGAKVQKAFQGDSEFVRLEDEDYKNLRDAVETPNPAVRHMLPEEGRQLMPFIVAIMEAKEE